MALELALGGIDRALGGKTDRLGGDRDLLGAAAQDFDLDESQERKRALIAPPGLLGRGELFAPSFGGGHAVENPISGGGDGSGDGPGAPGDPGDPGDSDAGV